MCTLMHECSTISSQQEQAESQIYRPFFLSSNLSEIFPCLFYPLIQRLITNNFTRPKPVTQIESFTSVVIEKRHPCPLLLALDLLNLPPLPPSGPAAQQN